MPLKRKQSTWRNVGDKDKILLWGFAAARCSYPDCKMRLVEPAKDEDAEAMFGQAAHIVAHKANGPRGDPDYPKEKLDTYENLILLCGNHHAIVDKQPNTYRCEDLRAWKGEHEKWVHRVTEPDQYKPIPWKVIIQEDEAKIDVNEAVSALAPDAMGGEPKLLHITIEHGNWAAAFRKQEQELRFLQESISPSDRRFAIFSLTRIPLAVHLGYVLSDRSRVILHQYDRDRNTWRWPQIEDHDTGLRAAEWTFLREEGCGPVCVRVSVSALVDFQDVQEVLPNAIADIHLRVSSPSVMWTRSPKQLLALGQVFREILREVREHFGNRCESVHLFYAGSTGGAIAVGRQYNPRMNPPLHLYEFHKNASPRYKHVYALGD